MGMTPSNKECVFNSLELMTVYNLIVIDITASTTSSTKDAS